MSIVKAAIAVLFVAGLGAVSVSFTRDHAPAVLSWQTEVMEAVGWDGGPGAPTDL